MLSVDEALRRMLAGLSPLEGEEIELSDAHGRVSAQEVRAPMDLPPWTCSAMDGFAARAAEVEGSTRESPTRLQVQGEVSAGEASPVELGSGTAMRIMTGAPLPKGADAVVPVEHTSRPSAMAGEEPPAFVEIHEGVGAGEFVREAGLDAREGELLVRQGQLLRPQEIGIMAAAGIASPSAHRRTRVAILSTGDELTSVGQPLGPGRIWDANGYALGAAVRGTGARPLSLGIAGDRPAEVAARLEQGLVAEPDLILTSGGVSMGASDYVREVLERRGELSYWHVNIRPGKPIVHGNLEGVPWVALPGNPVSVLVAFEVSVRPMLDKLKGLAETRRWRVRARVTHAITSDGRESFLRAQVEEKDGEYWATLTGSQDSSVLSSLVAADGLLHLPAGVCQVEPGLEAEIWMLDHESAL